MMEMLEVQNLSAGYGSSNYILFDVSMKVNKNWICTILGPNGSGKSTLLKAIFGLVTVHKGSIKLKGEEITQKKPHEIAKLGVSYLPQTENVYENLTARDNLIMGAYLLSEEETEERIEEVIEFFPELKNYLHRKIYMMSGGERQMLIMARALLRNPILLMLDEPSANLAKRQLDKVFNKIRELRDYDITVILVEQNVKKALEIADYSYLLASGKVIYNCEPEKLKNNRELVKLYLGLA